MTQAAQPTVSISVDQNTEEATITTTAGTVTYNVDGGTATAYTVPFTVTAGTTVNALAVDCSLDLCSTTSTYSLPITRNSDPVLSVSINQDTGETTVSYGTSTNTTYDIGSGVTTYNDIPFTVVKDTNMTVTAVDCSGVLCSGTSTVSKTITQAAAPTVNITINDENGAVSLSPSADATETTYDVGSGYGTYSSSFTPADGTTVNASARNCSTDLCSAAGTGSLTVTYGTTPTVTISMDDSGNLVVTTDTASADTQIRYGWASGSTTTTYSAPLTTTSDYSFGDTLYVEARSKDGANVWSSWSTEQSFETMGSTVSAAVTTTPNSDWTQLSFTSTGNDIEYQVLSSYDNTGVTGAVWTEGTSATIRTGDINHDDLSFFSAGVIQLAEISTRSRDCVNTNVAGSCSAWVDELNTTYGTEEFRSPNGTNDGVDTVSGANGEITFRTDFDCVYDRCMPVTSLRWYYQVDVNPLGGNTETTWEYTDTFQIDRVNPSAYVTPQSGTNTWTTEGEFVAAAGYSVLNGQTAHWGTTTVADTSGTIDLPVVDDRIKKIHISARWAGSPAGTYDNVENFGTGGWVGGYCWDPSCL